MHLMSMGSTGTDVIPQPNEDRLLSSLVTSPRLNVRAFPSSSKRRGEYDISTMRIPASLITLTMDLSVYYFALDAAGSRS